MSDPLLVRWFALLPDPVTGLDAPIADGKGQSLEWLAPDRETASAAIKRSLTPQQFRLCAVVSAVDWAARQRDRQYAKLTKEPKASRGAINAKQRCMTCQQPTFSPHALYCNRCRRSGPRVHQKQSASP